MNKLLAVADNVIDITDVTEVKEEISRFGRWLDEFSQNYWILYSR